MNAPARLSVSALAIEHTPDHVERFKVTDRASWLERRQADVTASVAGALFGVHEYATAFQLYQLKTGRIVEDPEETEPMRRGRLLEPVARQLLRELRPKWDIVEGTHYYRDPAARMGATPDTLAFDPDRGFGVVQHKSVEPSIFRSKWKVDDWNVQPPLWIAIQAAIEAELTGAKWAAVAPLVVSFGLDLPIIDIPLIPELMARARAEIARFWGRVAADDPPPPDYGKDGAILAELYASDNGEIVDLTGWNEGPEIAAEDKRLASEIKAMEARRKAIKAEFLHRMGEAAGATYGGALLATAKTVRRGAYEVKSTTYRDIRLKDVA